MGRSKAELQFGSETLLERTVRILAQVCPRIVIVAAEDQAIPEFPYSVVSVRDPFPHGGPLVGLGAGLLAAEREGANLAFVTSCDTPFLKTDVIHHLVKMLQNHDVVVPKDDKYHYPLAAVYRTSLHREIQDMLEEEERRPRALYSRCSTLEVPTTELQRVDNDLHCLMNLNTPADYASALRMANLTIPSWVNETPTNQD